jgi:GH24 family phage-related lysozyme (muramidase)
LETNSQEQNGNSWSRRNNFRIFTNCKQDKKKKMSELSKLATDLIIKYEGFNPKAVWDYGAWRIGYGSGTITLNNGTYRTTKQGDTTTKDNAFKDLQRRIVEFEKKLINQVGEQYWNKLSDQAKAPLISMAYNYGGFIPSLTQTIEAIKTGNNKIIASTILKETKDHNKSKPENIRRALYERRKKEADLINQAPQSNNKGKFNVLLALPLLLIGVYLIKR